MSHKVTQAFLSACSNSSSAFRREQQHVGGRGESRCDEGRKALPMVHGRRASRLRESAQRVERAYTDSSVSKNGVVNGTLLVVLLWLRVVGAQHWCASSLQSTLDDADEVRLASLKESSLAFTACIAKLSSWLLRGARPPMR